MTPQHKARLLLAKYGHPTAIIISEEMIKTFDAVAKKYSRVFVKTLDFWMAVKAELTKSG